MKSQQTKPRKSSAEAKLESHGLDAVRSAFNQIKFGSEDFVRFERMSFQELSKFVSKHEHLANLARFAMWKRHELKNTVN